MPILGQPVEPAHTEMVKPWWRDVEAVTIKSEPATDEITVHASVPWPLD
jgi:hypothetical protein